MKILLAVDGSEYSKEAAAKCGRFIKNSSDVTVKIVTVADYTADIASEPFISSKEFLEQVEVEMKKKSSKILSEAEEIVSAGNEEVHILKEMFIGSAKKLIVQEAKKWGADVLVVGSHGYGFWSRAFLGSVSDAVIHHAPCSVLVVRKPEV